MADFPHSYKTIPSLLGDKDLGIKTWVHPIDKQHYLHDNKDYFKYYDYERVPIEQLVKDNPFEGSETYNEKYDPKKDNTRSDVIYATRKMDGSLKLANGRHRIKALANAGYTHAYIPIHEEIIPDELDLKETFYTLKDAKQMNKLAKALPYILQHDPEYIKRLQKLFRNKARSLRR